MRKTKKVLLALALTLVSGVTLATGVACKDKNKGTLKFVTNGGEAVSSITKKDGAEVDLPTPQREGFQFEGWYDNKDFSGSPVTSIVVDGNATYYAKWSQLCLLTLDANGGSLDTTKVYLAVDSNVYEAVSKYVPTKAGMVFGAWFNGEEELTKTTRITEAGLTLVAQYKVEYAVEVYVQNLADDGYTKSAEASYVGSDYVGQTVMPDVMVQGCKQVANANEVLSMTLTAEKASNLLKVYFDRNTYTVMFNPNYPDGEEGEISKTAKYGEEIEISADVSAYFREGYCMLGWATSADSDEVTFAADLSSLLYNSEETTSKTYTYKVERNTMLYGVWQKGYTDMFGGDDYIYCFQGIEGMEDVVYLARGSVFFQGEYQADSGEFYFYDYTEDELGELVIRGKLFDNGKFLYNNNTRAVTSVSYVSGKGVDENVKIRFDSLNGAVYTVYEVDANGKTQIKEESEGTYENVSGAEYKATFTKGALAGQTKHFLIGTVTTAGGEAVSAFQMRNDEEYNAGKIILTGAYQEKNAGYAIGYAQTVYLQLDGFGTATFTSGSSSTTYNYRKNEDGTYSLTNKNDVEEVVVRVVEDVLPDGKKGYVAYQKNLDGEFVLEGDGVLKLDGLYQATYVNGDKTIASYYIATEMPMGGTLISIIDNKDSYKEYKFLLNFVEADGTYTIQRVLNSYAEYYYKNAQSTYYAPMLVVDEKEAGKASVYGYTDDGKYVKVSEGEYTQSADGLYLYEAKNTFDADVSKTPINLAEITSFVFAMDAETLGYSVHYWYSSNGEGGETSYVADYKDGKQSLRLVGGFGYYREDDKVDAVLGTYTQSGNVISLADQKNKTITYYFEIDDETKTFVVLEYAPYTAYLRKNDNVEDGNYALAFDGKGGATYTVQSGDEKTVVEGVVVATDKETAFGEKVLTFTSKDGKTSFDFISVTVGLVRNYFLTDDYTAGEYFYEPTVGEAGVLTIDGYAYYASFQQGEKTQEGRYIVQDGALVFYGDRTYYFDVQANRVVTMRGEEYGEYTILDNQYISGLYVTLDGYGGLSVFTLEKNADGTYKKVYVTKTGEYTEEGDVLTLLYTTGTQAKSLICQRNAYAYIGEDGNTYGGITTRSDVAEKVLVDTKEWSVLLLDEFGNATKYDAAGQKQTGRVMMISSKLLYFTNANGTDACLYSYNMSKATATPISLTPRSYYTQDLKSLYFSKYGFAIFNGETDNVIFYNYENGNIVIYRRPLENESANTEYGFIREDFGKLEDVKEYNGDPYYRNYGNAIIFNRKATNADKYPVLSSDGVRTLSNLEFNPSGGVEFSVNGYVDVTLGGTTTRTACNVVRQWNEETQQSEMYLVVGGNYRFYIHATYFGDNAGAANTYEIYDMQYVQELPSYRYLDVLYRVYAMYGASGANAFKNTIGTMALKIDFDENGKEESSVFSAEFGEDSALYDVNGNKLQKIDDCSFVSVTDGLYMVEFTHQDGYLYRLYVGVQLQKNLGAKGYFVYALVRVQNVEAGEYTVSVGRVTETDVTTVKAGAIFSIDVQKDGESVYKNTLLMDESLALSNSTEELFEANGVWNYVVREKNENGIVTAATYYCITLQENNDGKVTEDRETFATYQSATVTVCEATIMREAEYAERYVEIVNGEVVFISLFGNNAVVISCEGQDGVYTVTAMDVAKKDVKTYTVTVNGEYVVIERV